MVAKAGRLGRINLAYMHIQIQKKPGWWKLCDGGNGLQKQAKAEQNKISKNKRKPNQTNSKEIKKAKTVKESQAGRLGRINLACMHIQIQKKPGRWKLCDGGNGLQKQAKAE